MDGRRSYDIDSLTDVALRVFSERGFDAASMDDVARAAGISKPSIYHHVAGKEALLERGLRRALDALFEILEDFRAREGRAIGRLRFILRRVAEITFGLHSELNVLFRVRGNSPVEREALERRRNFDRIVAGLVLTAQREGDARDDIDPALVTRLLFGMSNSMVEWYRPGPPGTQAQLAAAVEALAFEGIVSRQVAGSG